MNRTLRCEDEERGTLHHNSNAEAIKFPKRERRFHHGSKKQELNIWGTGLERNFRDLLVRLRSSQTIIMFLYHTQSNCLQCLHKKKVDFSEEESETFNSEGGAGGKIAAARPTSRTNEQDGRNPRKQDYPWIGILDIFGFEQFDSKNGFQTFLINYANESIQNTFNHFVFQVRVSGKGSI